MSTFCWLKASNSCPAKWVTTMPAAVLPLAGRPRGSLPNSKLALNMNLHSLNRLSYLGWTSRFQPGRHTERRSASPANLSEISSCLKKSETSSCRQLLTCPALPIRVAALWRSHPGIGASRRAQGRRPFSPVCFSMSVTKARPNSSPATCFLCKMPAEEAPSRCHGRLCKPKQRSS